MRDAFTQDNLPDHVEIIENMSEWFVRVVRVGRTHISTFDIEIHARSYAAAERAALRLNLSDEKSE